MASKMKKIQEMWVDKSQSSDNLYNLYPKTLSDLVLLNAWNAASPVTLASVFSTGDSGTTLTVQNTVSNTVVPSETASSALGSADKAYAAAYINAIAPVTAAGSYLGTSSAKYAVAYIDEVHGNADTATTLATSRNIGLTGTGITATAAEFNGGSDVNIAITAIDGTAITTGKISIDRLPEAALPKLKVVANLGELRALTYEDVQVGDTVKVTAAIPETTESEVTFGPYRENQMFFVKDDTVLATAEKPSMTLTELKTAFEPYSAVVDWSSILNKPTTVTGYGITDAKITVKGGSEASDTFTVSANNGAETFEIAASGAASTSVSGKAITVNAVDQYPTAMSWTNGTTAGPTATITMAANGTTAPEAISVGAFPEATGEKSGVVTTTTQTFAGDKTFSGKVKVSDTLTVGANIVSDAALVDNVGTPAVPFAAGYVGAIHVESAADTSVIDIDATGISINPATTETGTIGTSTKKWSNGYFTTVHGELDGNASTATKLAATKTIEGVAFDGSANIINYAKCETAAATADKTATCTGFTLATGARVIINFTLSNSASNITLNINNGTADTGAKPIFFNNTRTSSLSAGLYEFVYDASLNDSAGAYCVVAGMDNGITMGTSADPSSSSSSFYFQDITD